VASVQQWEYRVEPAPAQPADLASWGDAGWELCAVAEGRLYLKRPRPSLQERVTEAQRRQVLASGRPLGADEGAPDGEESAPALLHPELARLLAAVGHTDVIALADRGFPVPAGVWRIDLALSDDLPTVLDVVRCLRPRLRIDRIVLAEEMAAVSPARLRALEGLLPRTPREVVPHQELKALARTAAAVVRTGDTVPYANTLLVVG
jgi:D-ribose pyranase